jgi:hypothetical protein
MAGLHLRRPDPSGLRLRVRQFRKFRPPADGEPELARELRHACGSDSNRDAPPRRRERRLASGPLFQEPNPRDPLRHAPAFPGRHVLRARAVSDLFSAGGVRARRGGRRRRAAHDCGALQPCSSSAAAAWTGLVGRVFRTCGTSGRSPDPGRARPVRRNRARTLGALPWIPLRLGARRAAELNAVTSAAAAFVRYVP